jgi:aminobenzoyl-glutamate utilization protein B
MAPTAQLRAATWVPGTPAHSWQAVAAGGMSIGTSGMMVAAKTLALTVAELFSDPRHVRDARAELVSQRGDGFRYESLVGDRDPPLDYRVNP